MKPFYWYLTVMLICTGIAGCRRSAESWNKKAHEAFLAGNRQEAITYCMKALALEADNVLAHFSLGWIYKLEGRSDEAIAEFKKVITISPGLGGAHSHLGDIYLEKGMLDEAIAEYRTAIEKQPESALTHYSLGIAYKRKGDLSAAADSLFEAGLVSIIYHEKSIATNAYNGLKETGNVRLAEELQEVLIPWFDPDSDVVSQTQ